MKLPYLTAVIDEGLRIFPSAPIGFVRTVPEDGDTVDGEFIPGGVCILSFPSIWNCEMHVLIIRSTIDYRLSSNVGSHAQREKLQGAVQIPTGTLARQGKQH